MHDHRTPKALAMLAALALAAAPAAIGAEQHAAPVEIRSVAISVAPLPAPRVYLDVEGAERTTDEVYIVELEGRFDVTAALAIDLYIGDHKIEEYGGTEKGVYFKVYDASLFERLDDQPFAFGIEGQRLQTLEMRFTPSQLRPFSRLKSPDPRAAKQGETKEE